MGVYYRLLNHTKKQFLDPVELSLDGSWNSIKKPGYMYGCGSLCLSYLMSRTSIEFNWVGDSVEWVGDTSDDYFVDLEGFDQYTNIGKELAGVLNSIGIDIQYTSD